MNGTLDLSEAEGTRWDVLVVGAGPAGSLAARALAQHGQRVLLVDEADFPRPKVCGGCLSAAALDVLERAGLGELPAELGALPLHTLDWHYGRSSVQLPMPAGAAISRMALDAALVREAVKAGAAFLPGTTAHLGPATSDARTLNLRRGANTIDADGRIILAADGLLGRLVNQDNRISQSIAPRSWMGLGGTFRDSTGTSSPVPEGRVCMLCGPSGYVGMVRVEDGQLNIAAALDPAFVRAAGGPAGAVRGVLDSAGIDVPVCLDAGRWLGTGLLTRRRWPPGVTRVLLLGDSAGYVEPFTGEGMGWATASALCIVPLALEAIGHWRDEMIGQWAQRQDAMLLRRREMCRAIAGALRHPLLAMAAMGLLRFIPAVGRRLVRRVHAPMRIPIEKE